MTTAPQSHRWAIRCTATAKATGEQCAAWAVRGCKTCYVHGSATQAAREAGKRRMSARNRRRELEKTWQPWLDRMELAQFGAGLGDIVRRMIDAECRAIERGQGPPTA